MPNTTYKISGLTVYFTFHESDRNYSFFRKIVRRIALSMCHLYCQWFQFFTRLFPNTGDKLLYIYFYLPFIVTHIFKKLSKDTSIQFMGSIRLYILFISKERCWLKKCFYKILKQYHLFSFLISEMDLHKANQIISHKLYLFNRQECDRLYDVCVNQTSRKSR